MGAMDERAAVEVPGVSLSEAQRGALWEKVGPQAAAWLVFKHRRQFAKTGAVDFHLPAGKVAPPWFLVAIHCLRLRTTRWEVRVTTLLPARRETKVRGWFRKGRSYRVRWLAWGSFGGAS